MNLTGWTSSSVMPLPGFNRPIMEQKVMGWDWTMNVNARGFLLCMQRAAPLMEKRGGGQVVAISSTGFAAGAARLCGRRSQQGGLRGAYPLCRGRNGPEEYRGQWRLSQPGRNGCLETFCLIGRQQYHSAGDRQDPRRPAGYPRGYRRGGLIPVFSGGAYDPRSGDHNRRRLHLDRTRLILYVDSF